MAKPRVAVHKFSSCDGCQLAFLNAGEALLTLSDLVDVVHFAEAGAVDDTAATDIAFIEGSITTGHESRRIQEIRQRSRCVITIGACATTGGLQALRQCMDSQDWVAGVYASPQYIKSLATSTAIASHIKVDFELWGCPVNGQQVLQAVRFLLFGVLPADKKDAECMECKRRGQVCVLITKKASCMGPVTKTGCGALCPTHGRGCYGCFGPQATPNTSALGKQFEQFGLTPAEVARQFLHINNQAPAFLKAGHQFKGIPIRHEP